MERRYFNAEEIELRQDADGETLKISGYAALFNRRSENLGGFVEILRPGCFRKVLEGNPDVKALFNHEPGTIFARTRNGTLTVSENQKGLKFEAIINPEDQDGARIHSKVKSGLIDQCSFAFAVPEDGQSWKEESKGLALREIHEVSHLEDVSVVVSPAYPQTSVQARSVLTEAGFDFDGITSLITRAQRGLPVTDSDRDLINSAIQVLQSYVPEESDGGDVDTHDDGDARRLQNILTEMELLEIKFNRRGEKN